MSESNISQGREWKDTLTWEKDTLQLANRGITLLAWLDTTRKLRNQLNGAQCSQSQRVTESTFCWRWFFQAQMNSKVKMQRVHVMDANSSYAALVRPATYKTQRFSIRAPWKQIRFFFCTLKTQKEERKEKEEEKLDLQVHVQSFWMYQIALCDNRYFRKAQQCERRLKCTYNKNEINCLKVSFST